MTSLGCGHNQIGLIEREKDARSLCLSVCLFLSLFLCLCTQRKVTVRTELSASQKEASLETISPDALTLNFWPPELWGNKLMLFKPTSLSFCHGSPGQVIQVLFAFYLKVCKIFSLALELYNFIRMNLTGCVFSHQISLELLSF